MRSPSTRISPGCSSVPMSTWSRRAAWRTMGAGAFADDSCAAKTHAKGEARAQAANTEVRSADLRCSEELGMDTTMPYLTGLVDGCFRVLPVAKEKLALSSGSQLRRLQKRQFGDRRSRAEEG